MEENQVPSLEAELAETLTAISVVAKRLASKLQSLEKTRQGGQDDAKENC